MSHANTVKRVTAQTLGGQEASRKQQSLQATNQQLTCQQAR
jgi:hypothetical protein